MRALLIPSLIANVLLGALYFQLHAEHANLLDWACDHGNGGHECGEL